jgi:hypothetical protein
MRSAVCLVVVVALSVLSGCGVPTGGDPETIAPSEVPDGLLSPSATTPAPSSSPALEDPPRVYLIGPDDVLLPSSREVDGAALRQRLDALLGQLATGPTAGERDAQLATALPPGVRLSVAGVDDGTVTIDLAGPGEAPSGEQSRLAVGQIVLTATSMPGVDAVLLTRAGEQLEAPLPSGELTTDPLRSADYDELLVSPPS